MSRRMPILRQQNVIEAPDEVVDQRHDLVPAGHRKRAAGTEIILKINDDQCLPVHDFNPVFASAIRESSTESDRAVNQLSPAMPLQTDAGSKLRFDNRRGLDIICVRMNFDRPAPGGIA